MAFIEEAGFLPCAMASAIGDRARETIQLAADQVPQGMAGEQIQREQDDVHQQHQRSDADAKVELLIGSREPEGPYCVIPEKAQEYDGAVKKIAMNVLQDKRESGLAAVIAVRALTHRAGRRIHEECAVIRFTVVIASNAKTERKRQNQQRRGKVPP